MKRFLLILLILICLAALGFCVFLSVQQRAQEPAETVPAPTEAVQDSSSLIVSEPASQPEAAVGSGRQNGERFQTVIILEGMEETVRYEHVRNDALGFEMDYDYESFTRSSDTGAERFISVYDNADQPENYLEVRYSPLSAEAAAESIGAILSNSYEISRDNAFQLESAGRCIRIDASADVGGQTMPEKLQMVYIIPASDGCRVATAHYSIESAEGFGRRFRYLMDSFTALPRQGEKRLTDGQALAAIRNYCALSNPDLAGILNAGEYPAYWEVSSSDGLSIVVVYRSYTGALTRYYVNPNSGKTSVTEFVPGITDQEQRTDETLNAWDYLF